MKNIELLKKLPSIDMLLGTSEYSKLIETYSRDVVKMLCQRVLDDLRDNILENKLNADTDRDGFIAIILGRVNDLLLSEFGTDLKPVINATGIILHTGLGRAPLSKIAQSHVIDIMQGYTNLELDMSTGKRGIRHLHVEKMICNLTGAEAAIVVNNNAAAVFIALNTLAFNRGAIISRGQLVEIGGSFRIPDVMEKSGAHMVEVGTTNKTKLLDYEKAIDENTGAIMVAHTSNYRVLGFTAEVTIGSIAEIVKDKDIPVIHDLGGGVLVDLQKYGLPYEPLVQDSIREGADIVTFSGDKVLGGPQSGIIAGKKKWIDKISQNPIMRAVRCDKLTYAALEATLTLFFQSERLLKEHTVLRMFTEPVKTVQERARKLSELIDVKKVGQYSVNIEESNAQAGSGALPLEKIPSAAVVVRSENKSIEKLAQKLRAHRSPVIGYIKNDALVLDMRTVSDLEIESLAQLLNKALMD